jgi:RHS repeat-associated protein
VEVQENSMTIAEYVYDGDGNRVESVVTDGSQTITTVYIGSYYEQITTVDGGSSTTEWNKYYYAGAVRLAMRENSEEPYYLITDHLGSTSLVVDSLGQEVARQSYLPFGEEWGSSVADLPTTFTYTGQREAAEIGLHFYIARWYDSGIGHFLQADTIITGMNAFAWNHYAYVNYTPLNYIDRYGHNIGLPSNTYVLLTGQESGSPNNEEDAQNIVKLIDELFDPIWGPYYSKENEEWLNHPGIYSMLNSILLAYADKGIDIWELAASGQTNPLTTFDVLQDNGDLSIMPIEYHISRAIDHAPYIRFFDLIDDELGVNYLGSDNFYMNFEPFFLSALMAQNPYVLLAAKQSYVQNQEEMEMYYTSYENWSGIMVDYADIYEMIMDGPRNFVE